MCLVNTMCNEWINEWIYLMENPQDKKGHKTTYTCPHTAMEWVSFRNLLFDYFLLTYVLTYLRHCGGLWRRETNNAGRDVTGLKVTRMFRHGPQAAAEGLTMDCRILYTPTYFYWHHCDTGLRPTVVSARKTIRDVKDWSQDRKFGLSLESNVSARRTWRQNSALGVNLEARVWLSVGVAVRIGALVWVLMAG